MAGSGTASRDASRSAAAFFLAAAKQPAASLIPEADPGPKETPEASPSTSLLVGGLIAQSLDLPPQVRALAPMSRI
jgi:hypothetical protein